MQLQDKDFSLCVVADDSVFLTIIAAQRSEKLHVMPLFPGLRDKGAEYLKAVAQENGFSMDPVVVLEKRKACLSKHDTDQKEVRSLQCTFYATLVCFGDVTYLYIYATCETSLENCCHGDILVSFYGVNI